MPQFSSAVSALAMSLLALSCLPSQAATADVSGPYIGGSIGRSNFDTHNLSLPKVGSDEHDTTYKFFGGYRLNQNLAFEGGYARLGSFSERVTLGGSTVEQNGRGRSLYGAVVGRLPLGESFALNGRLGLSFGKVSGANLLPASSNLTGSNRSVLVGIGAEYQVAPKVTLTVDYDRFGRISDRVSANLLTAGVKLAF